MIGAEEYNLTANKPLEAYFRKCMNKENINLKKHVQTTKALFLKNMITGKTSRST